MEMKKENRVYISFPAIPENERLSRMIAAAFLAEMNPTVEELDDVKTAVSEAVTNAIIHAYDGETHVEEDRKNHRGEDEKNYMEERPIIHKEEQVELILKRKENVLFVEVTDKGKGIENIELAMEPMYTTGIREERSGMGFSFMEAFMDELRVESEKGYGTKIFMKKSIGIKEELR